MQLEKKKSEGNRFWVAGKPIRSLGTKLEGLSLKMPIVDDSHRVSNEAVLRTAKRYPTEKERQCSLSGSRPD